MFQHLGNFTHLYLTFSFSPFIFCLCAEVLEIIIRNNKDIKGILIEVEEYNFSQYADDTTLFSNGSR